MKKSLIALAVLAAAGAASAQSSVTLFGVVDATLAFGSGSVADRTQLTNSGYNSSRLGFRGTEDLGGGMSASFWLEAGVNNDDGTGAAHQHQQPGYRRRPCRHDGGQGLTFNRRSTVSLAGGWGELRLGRDYTPAVLEPDRVRSVRHQRRRHHPDPELHRHRRRPPSALPTASATSCRATWAASTARSSTTWVRTLDNVRRHRRRRQRPRPARRLRRRPVQRRAGSEPHRLRHRRWRRSARTTSAVSGTSALPS